jgi:restriction system protein
MRRRGFGGILSAIARDVARAQRQAEANRKRQLRAQAQQMREALREERQLHLVTERQTRQDERAARQQYWEDRIAEAAARNAELQNRIEKLRGILTYTLSVNDTIHFDDLRIKDLCPVFSPPPELLTPKSIPQKEVFLATVKTPGKVSQLLPWVKSRHQRELAAAEARYEEALRKYGEEDEQRQTQLASLRANYERSKQVFDQKVKQRDQEVDELEAAYRAGEPEVVATYNTMVLERSEYPDGFPQEFQVAYVPESKQLVIEYEIPAPAMIPSVAEYRYVKTRDIIDEKLRKPAEIKDLY